MQWRGSMSTLKNRVPKIIHHIAPADKSKWNPIWYKCYDSWIKNFPDIELKLWNDNTDLDDLIETYYPQFAKIYDNFPYKIMKINFARFAMLHHFGGIYADMDIFCYRNFFQILGNHDLFLIENFLSETVNGHFPFEICMMAASEKNEFMLDCMINSIEQFKSIGHLFEKDSIDDEWLIVMLTDAIALQSRNLHDPEQISLLPYHIFNNRAASYHPSFYTKHMRSSAWNKTSVPDKYLVIENLLFSITNSDNSVSKLLAKSKEHQLVDIDKFDFYHDYSNGKFFVGEEQFDSMLKKETQRFYNEIIS